MLANALVLALIVYFIKVTTWPGHIWQSVGYWAEEKLPEKLYKPFIGCPVCMTPWWGTILYLIAHFTSIPGYADLRIQTIIFTIFTAAGINSIILMFNKVYDTEKKEEKILDKKLKNE